VRRRLMLAPSPEVAMRDTPVAIFATSGSGVEVSRQRVSRGLVLRELTAVLLNAERAWCV
jgi:hypothetical protein